MELIELSSDDREAILKATPKAVDTEALDQVVAAINKARQHAYPVGTALRVESTGAIATLVQSAADVEAVWHVVELDGTCRVEPVISGTPVYLSH